MEISSVIPGWNIAGFVAVIGLLMAALKALYTKGGKDRSIDDAVKRIEVQENCLKDLKRERTNDREADRIKIENQFAALYGGVTLLKDQVAEFRTEVTRMYSTKEEARQIEERLNNALTRLFGHIDSLSDEIKTMNRQIIAAISDRNHQIDDIRKQVK